MTTRPARLALSALVTAGALTVATAMPASAATAAEGVGTRGPSGLSLAEILLLFVGIPALVFTVCAALVFATAGKREPRLREGAGWWSEPEYFSGADTADQPAVVAGSATGELTAGDEGDGGSSARW